MKLFAQVLLLAILREAASSHNVNISSDVTNEYNVVLSVTVSDSSDPNAVESILLVEPSCLDGSIILAQNESQCIIDSPKDFEAAPVSVNLTELIPGKEYTFSSGNVTYNLSDSTIDNATSAEFTFCARPLMPANVTAREGANIDDIDFTVGNNSDGFVGGYFLFYSVWNGTMFIGVNASFPAASGSINGLDKGKVYQLSFYSDSECDQGITLSTNGLIEYFQVALDAPSGSVVTLVHDGSDEMCFVWFYNATTFNAIKVELSQSGSSKGSAEMATRSIYGAICVSHSGLANDAEVLVEFSVGYNVTTDVQNHLKFSEATKTTVNATGYSILVHHQTNCTDQIEKCTLLLILHRDIHNYESDTTIVLHYSSGSTVDETVSFNLSDSSVCTGGGSFDYECNIELTGLTLSQYDFHPKILIYGDQVIVLEYLRVDNTTVTPTSSNTDANNPTSLSNDAVSSTSSQIVNIADISTVSQNANVADLSTVSQIAKNPDLSTVSQIANNPDLSTVSQIANIADLSTVSKSANNPDLSTVSKSANIADSSTLSPITVNIGTNITVPITIDDTVSSTFSPIANNPVQSTTQISASPAGALNITLNLLGKTEYTANITVNFLGGTPDLVQLAAASCHDGNSSSSPVASECNIDAPTSYEAPPIVVLLTGLVPGNKYTFSSGPVNYRSSGADFTASLDIITFCTVPAAPANITAVEGNALTAIDYTVSGGSPGEVGGYDVIYKFWNGTDFEEIGSDNSGSIGGLSVGTLYKLIAFAQSECSSSELSEGNATVFYVTAVTAPANTDITLVLKDSTKICFVWTYNGPDTFNAIKLELVQSSTSKGIETQGGQTAGPGVICVVHGSLVTDSEAEAQFAVGNIITAEGETYQGFSDPTNKTVNTTDFKLLLNYENNCTENIENCTATASLDKLIDVYKNNATIELTYTSGSNVNETRLIDLTDPADCVGNATTDYTCIVNFEGLNLTEYEFDLHISLYGVELYHLELSRGGGTSKPSDSTRCGTVWFIYAMATIMTIIMAGH
ncbi:uncharacterized protein LOC142342783 isoform X2 [Convolutriloba macropyga]|uniref:uncharacterized protein LOC142342783 isoform X2 n=1 Tax=Convolutriloba macropyga TaxID=536237 RepID=UPI003F522EC7